MSYPSNICVKVLVIFSSCAAVKPLWSHLFRFVEKIEEKNVMLKRNVHGFEWQNQHQNCTWPFEGIKIHKICGKSSFSKETLCVWLRHQECLNAFIVWILMWRWCSADVRSLGTCFEMICGFVINLYEHIRWLWCTLFLTKEQIDIHNVFFFYFYTAIQSIAVECCCERIVLVTFPSFAHNLPFIMFGANFIITIKWILCQFVFQCFTQRSLALAHLLQFDARQIFSTFFAGFFNGKTYYYIF